MRDWPFMNSKIPRRGTLFVQCLSSICNRLTMLCFALCMYVLSLFFCLLNAFFKITGRFCKLFFSLHHRILSSSRQIMQLLLAVIYIRTELIFCTKHSSCYLTYFLAQRCSFCIVI